MTANKTNPPTALAGLRVLELGGMVAVPYCGKLLASLGADVVKVEPPKSGDLSRRRGPFPGDSPHPERSGMFLYLNTGKRGVTLDVDDPQGRRMLRRLAADVDAIIHDSPPALAAARGLEQEALAEINPRLVVAAITPFGSTGPNAGYAAHDVTVFHAGGEGNLLPNGQVIYKMWPSENRYASEYNLVRHTLATWNLVQAWEMDKERTEFLTGAQAALDFGD